MPVVDLSTIGLDGQQAFATRMQTLAQAESMRVNAQGQQLENEKTQAMNELNELASQKLRGVLHRDPQSPIDPQAMAEHMESLAEPLEAAAGIYMSSGFGVETGRDLLKSASEIRKRESDMKNSEVKAQQERLDNIIKGADVVGRWLGGATTEDEWKLGMQRIRQAVDEGLFVLEPEMLEKIEGLPFDPNAAAFFRDQAISAADKARLERQDADDRRQDERFAFDKAARTTSLQMQAARDAETKRHRETMEKASGRKGSSLTPTGVEVSQARTVLVNSVYKGTRTKDSKDVDEAAVYVASLAKTIVANNKALSWDQAVQQAIVQASKGGVFTTEGGEEGSAGYNILGFTFGETADKPGTPKFKRTGRTADSAMLPPINSSGKVDPSKLVSGRYYVLTDGTKAKFDGKDFILDD